MADRSRSQQRLARERALGLELGTWIVQLVLPAEVVRWEWKRFRQTFGYAAAQVICSCRQELRVSAAHRWYASLVAAHQKPQP